MHKLVAISEAAKLLGVHPTLCVVGNAKAKSSRAGLLAIFAATTSLIFAPFLFTLRLRPRVRTVAYARVSSHDQKEDLERQKQVLESYCAAQGWTFELVADLGSGMNYRKQVMSGASC
jgi:putative resolvase